MISNAELSEIINECKQNNHNITVRDIAYVVLCRFFDNADVSYRCIYGESRDYSKEYGDTYDKTDDINYLKQYVDYLISRKKNIIIITFSGYKVSFLKIHMFHLKKYMLKLKKDTEDAMANGEIEKKDGLKILSDLSVKLNDKFQVKDEAVEQVVQVNIKYNSVCSCGREIYIPTKLDLMEKYNLIEKK